MTVATICARGGSKGLPGKNIRPLAGLPLIAHTIGHALDHPEIDAVYVSTDDPEIARIAEGAGAQVPFLRPPELATDDAAKVPVIEHIIGHIEGLGQTVARIVDLQPTSPLRRPEDIDGCLAMLDADVDCVVTAALSGANPYYNLVEADPAGIIQLSKRLESSLVARQHAPAVYAITGSVYCWRRDTLGLGVLGGRTRMHLIPAERALDIDDEIDFQLAELLLAKAGNEH